MSEAATYFRFTLIGLIQESVHATQLQRLLLTLEEAAIRALSHH